MTDLEQYLQDLMSKVCTDLARMYPSEQQPSEYGLIFPTKRDGSVRISEQEAKLLFVQHLTIDRRFCFSVETPTAETYQQTGDTPMSARVDLTLFGPERKPLAHIELKAHNCKVEAIRKDLEKLLREKTTGLWFHTLHRANRRTLEALIGKFRSAFSLLPEALRTNDRSYLIAFFVLDEAVLSWRWLRFAGCHDLNWAAVTATVGEGVDRSSWAETQFRAKQTDEQPNAPSKNRKTAVSGKGLREAFLVFAPEVAPDTALHLSVRGGSYRLRQYNLKRPGNRPRVFTVPECPSFQTLRATGIIAQWISVTAEDYGHSIDEQPQYWCDRIQAVNRKHLSAEDDKSSTLPDPLR
jgi:hypothetical protein